MKKMRKMKRKFARAFALAVLGMAAVWAVTARQGDFEIKHGVLVKYRGNAAEVVVPAGLTAIGERSFSECDKLNAITLQALKPPVLTSQFVFSKPSTLIIYVPASAVDAYKKADGWKNLLAGYGLRGISHGYRRKVPPHH